MRDLIRSEIYPIVIHVEVTEKNIRGLRYEKMEGHG